MRKILADVAEKDIFESVTITVNYKDGYSRVDTVYLKGGERLVLESGPDPVEKIKARIAEWEKKTPDGGLTADNARRRIEELRFAIAAIEGKEEGDGQEG